MSDATPKRRWLRFSLRTMFVVVTIVACWLTYELNWVRQRRHEIITGSVVARQDPKTHLRAPGILAAFGEQGYTSITVLVPNCHRVTAADELTIARVQRLFPEAAISYLSGTPGEFLDRSSPYHPLNRAPDDPPGRESPEDLTVDVPSGEDPFSPE